MPVTLSASFGGGEVELRTCEPFSNLRDCKVGIRSKSPLLRIFSEANFFPTDIVKNHENSLFIPMITGDHAIFPPMPNHLESCIKAGERLNEDRAVCYKPTLIDSTTLDRSKTYEAAVTFGQFSHTLEICNPPLPNQPGKPDTNILAERPTDKSPVDQNPVNAQAPLADRSDSDVSKPVDAVLNREPASEETKGSGISYDNQRIASGPSTDSTRQPEYGFEPGTQCNGSLVLKNLATELPIRIEACPGKTCDGISDRDTFVIWTGLGTPTEDRKIMIPLSEIFSALSSHEAGIPFTVRFRQEGKEPGPWNPIDFETFQVQHSNFNQECTLQPRSEK
jgi:hypothetical protein